jgi:hypothetical protein
MKMKAKQNQAFYIPSFFPWCSYQKRSASRRNQEITVFFSPSRKERNQPVYNQSLYDGQG